MGAILGAFLFVGAVLVVAWAVIPPLSDGSMEGSLDWKYPNLPSRESDHYTGIRRSLYEIAYWRSEETAKRRVRITAERRKQNRGT